MVEQSLRKGEVGGSTPPIGSFMNKHKNYPGQIHDFIAEAENEIATGGRVLATTLTKKMAEDLSLYLKERGLRAEYLHSEIKTLERIEILTRLRRGEFDVLVGVNLLREGLDLPEITLIGILDADKSGFLRSETSLIQTIGRAARNVNGRVILYADEVTDTIKNAVAETERRRKLQIAHNRKYGITPRSIQKEVSDITDGLREQERHRGESLEMEIAISGSKKKLIKEKEKLMSDAVKELDFETAAVLRDEIKVLEGLVEKR